MIRLNCLLLAAVVLLAAGNSAFGQGAKTVLELDKAQLVALLGKPDAPTFEKAKACQRLAVIGTEDSIPALAALLSDDTLNVYARTALENIPSAKAGQALRDAAGKLTGRSLAGVLDSLGAIRDEKSVDLLAKYLSGKDSEVAVAAAAALARVANDDAAHALLAVLKPEADIDTAFGIAALRLADELAAAGKQDQALAAYRAVRKSKLPDYLKVDAIQGELRLRQGEATDLLVEQLKSDKAVFFHLGLAAAREIPGKEVTQAVTAEFDGFAPDRKPLVLLALGDRVDSVPLALALASVKSDDAALREAAVRVLARSGDASALTILLDTALDEGDAARTARERLRTLNDKRVDAAILERLKDADASPRVVLLELAGARGIVAALAAAREALSAENEQVRQAAIGALGQLIDLGEFDLLLDRALGETGSPETMPARAALRTAALRTDKRDECSTLLAARLEKASPEARAYLLELLGQLGSRPALEAVAAAARSNVGELKDAATKVLGEWPNADAAPELLRIAREDSEQKYRVRALRGYLRVARQLQIPGESRLEMFQTAMQTAQRDEEKQLALDVLTRIPSAETLKLAGSYLKEPALVNDAATAVVKIAPKLTAADSKVVAEVLAAVANSNADAQTTARAKQLLERAGVK